MLRTMLACAWCSPLFAQTTWLVNASGGPGVQFTDLAAAVAAAADGDTIVCQQPTFGESLGGFTTNKGLTIVGDANGVPLTTNVAPVQVVGLPAGRTFRMAGFQAVLDGQLRIVLQNCAGRVELDNLQAREPDAMFPTTPGLDIANCASVVVRDVCDFGVPAVRVAGSQVLLSGCWLGITRIGVGGGPCLWATNATVEIVQPMFRTGGIQQAPGVWFPAIDATNSVLRLAGDASAMVSGGPPLSTLGGSAIVASGGSVVLDPAVGLLAGLGQPLLAGTAPVVVQPVPASWLPNVASPGQAATIRTTAASGAAVFVALGLPGPLTSTVFGTVGLDLAAPPVFFPLAVVPAAGVVNQPLPVPAGLPRGQTFTTQAVVWDGVLLQFGLPTTFVVQ